MNTPGRFEFAVRLESGRRRREEDVSKPERLLLLAHQIERLIGEGKLKNWSEAAGLLQVSRARLAQIARFLLLSPDIQEEILRGKKLQVSERQMRPVLAEPFWSRQRKLWRKLLN